MKYLTKYSNWTINLTLLHIQYIIVILQALLVETLNEDDEKRPEQEMEITFEPGLQETAEQLVQRKLGEFYFVINPTC